jgi:hypothetical protein
VRDEPSLDGATVLAHLPQLPFADAGTFHVLHGPRPIESPSRAEACKLWVRCGIVLLRSPREPRLVEAPGSRVGAYPQSAECDARRAQRRRHIAVSGYLELATSRPDVGRTVSVDRRAPCRGSQETFVLISGNSWPVKHRGCFNRYFGDRKLSENYADCHVKANREVTP